MKKVIIIAMLMSLLCVCGLSAGVCFADETSNPTYYYVNSDKELTVYAYPQMENNHSIFQIPSTYAFKYVKKENDDFVEIEYNKCKGYVSVSNLNSICSQVNAKWGNNPYEYKYTASDFNSFSADKVTAYSFDSNVWTPTNQIPVEYMTVTDVYGYYKDSNEEVYFLVKFTTNLVTEQTFDNYYIKASNFTTAQANLSNIPDSEGYKAQTKPDSTISSGSSNSGNATNTTNNKGGSSPKDTSNSFERYILIAVIAVLCVVIIILIFAPTRKRQH